MTYALVNQMTGKTLRLPDKVATEFFGATEKERRIMCLPCSAEVQGEAQAHVYEVSEVKRKRKVKGTCVIRMGGLGDLLMMSSGLRVLQDEGEKITVSTLPQHVQFMRSMGFKAIPLAELGKFSFDKVIDLRFSVEPKELGQACKGTWADYTMKDRSDAFDELLGVYPAKKRFEIPVSAGAAKRIRSLVGSEKYVAINACMVAAARSIPKKYIRPLAVKLLKHTGGKVVLFGSSQQWNKDLRDITIPHGIVNLIDQTSLEEMIALIAMADVVVTPDTGSLHIAAALGKKTLAVFGNINPRTRVSYYPTVRTIYPQGELKCIPCWDLHQCSSDTGKPVKCMELITPDRMVNAVRELGGYE